MRRAWGSSSVVSASSRAAALPGRSWLSSASACVLSSRLVLTASLASASSLRHRSTCFSNAVYFCCAALT